MTRKLQRGLEEFERQKRLYEKSLKAKVARLQRRSVQFWAPCLCNWIAMRTNVDRRAANNEAAYAPRFHSDGRISILQDKVEKFLPCPQEPGKEASLKQLDEFALALELRCRIGGINCRRLGIGREQEAACCKKQDRNSRKRQREL